MLILSALKAVVGKISVDEDTLLKALEDADLDHQDTYDKTVHQKKIDLCAIEVLETWVSHPDISEGDLSIKVQIKGAELKINALKGKWNIPVKTSGPKVRIRNMW